MPASLPAFDDLIASDAVPTLVIGEAIDDCNAAARKLFGSGTRLLRSLPLASLLPCVQPDGSESVSAWHQRIAAAREGLPQWFLWQFVRHDGGLIDALVHLSVDGAKTAGERPGGQAPVRARLRDMTDFRGVEWSRMQQALAGTAAIVFAKDIEGRYLFANRQFAEITGCPLEELIGRRDIEVLPPDMAEECRRNDTIVLAERRPMDFEEHGVIFGDPRAYLTIKFPLLRADGGAYGVWGISTDITARKRTEEAMRHAALAVSQADGEDLVPALTRYLATILEVDLALIGVIEGEGEERVVRTIGRFGDGVYKENESFVLSTTPCRTVLDGFRCYRSGVQAAFPEERTLGPQGFESYAGYPLRATDGRLLGVIAVLSRSPIEDEALVESVLKIFAGRAADEIERHRAEEALRESEEQYRAIFNASVDGMLLWNSAGKVVDANEAFARMHGFQPQELVGRDCEHFVPADRRRHCQRMVAAALSGQPVGGESLACRRDGSLFDVEVHAVPMQYRNEPHVLAIVRDVTERKREEARRAELEVQLRQAQKMEAIGHLTGGIAHDFNNLLASIMGYVVLAIERQNAHSDSRLEHYLQQAHMSCERARDLIRQMLTFSRGQRGEPRPLSMGTAVRESVKLLRASFPSTMEMHTELDHSLPAVLIDPVQFEQVLLNLCINARDAIHASGTIRLGSRMLRGHRGLCTSCRQPIEGDFVELSVSDDGPGIDSEVLDRMFEPFFSTKEIGKGSGMGLATVHGIVHEHHGHIVVDTSAGEGSSFRVLLPPLDPAIDGAAPQPAADTGRAAARATLSGHVLLVDDETSVLGFMRELLENWGLRVTALADPLEARRLLESDALAFDLLLADQTMPRLTGAELAGQLAAAHPEVPALLYTGYSDGISKAELAASGVRAVLDKPVDPEALHAQLLAHLATGRDRPDRGERSAEAPPRAAA